MLLAYMYNISTNLLAKFMLLFGLRDVFDSLVVAEMFSALFEEMFRSEAGFGLGRLSVPCQLAQPQKVPEGFRSEGLQSGFIPLDPEQLSACAEDASCSGVSLVEL